MLAAVAAGAGCQTSSLRPMQGAIAVSAGGSHACAVMVDGSARCWGDNVLGELGSSAAGQKAISTPVVVDLSNVVQISAGGDHTCAVQVGGTTWCWGENEFGQLGSLVTTGASMPPTQVTGLTGVSAVAATGMSLQERDGAQEYSCALASGGAVFCWGENINGEIGNGMIDQFVAAPSEVRGVTGATALALGGSRVYAVLGDGTVTSWGSDALTNSPTPVPVPGLTSVVSIAAGQDFACAVRTDGTVACWGLESSGELGDGNISGEAAAPEPVAGLTGVISISAGTHHACAVLTDETVRCWGDDILGQLGDNEAGPQQVVPVPVRNLSGVVMISAGPDFTCALLEDSEVDCWGADDAGQLGDGQVDTNGVGVALPVSQP